MVRPGILGKDARRRSKSGLAFSILIPLVAAILLFIVIHAKLRGEQLPDFVIFIETVGFVAVIFGRHLVLASGIARAPRE